MTVVPELSRFIEGSSWWKGLTADQAERVRRHATSRRYEAGATVCARGSPSVQWLGVIDGILKVETASPDGKSTTFAGVPSGAWFGEGAVLKGEPRPYGVVAIRDSLVASLPRETFLFLIDESRPFSRWVIDQLNARLGHYVALIENYRFQDSAGRVAYCLSELFNPHLYPGTQAQLPISQEEIARLSGLSRQNVNHSLHDLEHAGLVRIRYGVIEVLDLHGLQAYARKE